MEDLAGDLEGELDDLSEAFGDLDLDLAGGPQGYGDDADLDALWDSCGGGDGDACDELFFSSPVGSAYEDFGDTCGGLFEAGIVLCSKEL